MRMDQKIPYLRQHNVDSGAFHTDPMYEACQPHFTPSRGLNSNNVKRAHNGRKAAKAHVGVTGGHVEDAMRNLPVDASWAPVRTLKVAKGPGRNARKRARRMASAGDARSILQNLYA